MAFLDLHRALISAPVLTLPQDEGRWKVEMDVSNLATGRVLLQQQVDGTWRVEWVGELQCFDFKIKYHTGKSNTKADAT